MKWLKDLLKSNGKELYLDWQIVFYSALVGFGFLSGAWASLAFWLWLAERVNHA